MSTQPVITGVKAQAYINANHEREERRSWWRNEAPRMYRAHYQALVAPKVGRPADPLGNTSLARLFGISVRQARRHRDELLRLPLMKPEARRLTVRMVMFG